MREFLKPTFVLLAITFVVSVAIATVNHYTKDIIAERLIQSSMGNRSLVLPNATKLEDITLEAIERLNGENTNIQEVFVGYRGSDLEGFVFDLLVEGYYPNMQVTVGILKNGEISKVIVGDNSETPGLGSRATEPPFTTQYEGLNLGDGDFRLVTTPPSAPNEIEAVSGATSSSRGVNRGVRGASELAKILLAQTE
jgi:Na+-translocating ferredoxin:NAD+ oxidoreductase subunit G